MNRVLSLALWVLLWPAAALAEIGIFADNHVFQKSAAETVQSVLAASGLNAKIVDVDWDETNYEAALTLLKDFDVIVLPGWMGWTSGTENFFAAIKTHVQNGARLVRAGSDVNDFYTNEFLEVNVGLGESYYGTTDYPKASDASILGKAPERLAEDCDANDCYFFHYRPSSNALGYLRGAYTDCYDDTCFGAVLVGNWGSGEVAWLSYPFHTADHSQWNQILAAVATR